MEDYTYHWQGNEELVLGAHMLEVCESIASSSSKLSCEIHPLSIGNRADPVRLVFDSDAGPAINVSLIDITPAGFVLRERAPGVSVAQIVAATAGHLLVPADVPEMTGV